MMRNEETGSFILVPKDFLNLLMEGQRKILALLENVPEKNQLGDYVSENEAQKMLGRKSTWFWSMRSKGKLPFAKVGNKVFYSRKDIVKLLEDHKTSNDNAH